MATVENVQLEIKASAGKSGYSKIMYSYELHPGGMDSPSQHEFTVTVDLWGEDVVDDDVLAAGLDEHKVKFDSNAPDKPVKVKRTFEVETKLLNEDVVGDDEVYLFVEAQSVSGPESEVVYRFGGKSNTVIGDF